MSVLQPEVYQAFGGLEVEDDKALKAARAPSAALGKVEDDTVKGFSKRDADIDTIRKDVRTLKVDTAVLKWMNGVMLTLITAVFFKLFFH